MTENLSVTERPAIFETPCNCGYSGYSAGRHRVSSLAHGLPFFLEGVSFTPRRKIMSQVLRAGWLCFLGVLFAVCCTVAPRPGSPVPPAAAVLPADARALADGQAADQVLPNAQRADKMPALARPDRTPAAEGRGQ